MNQITGSSSSHLSQISTNGEVPPSTQHVTPPSIARETFDALLGFSIMSFGDMTDISRGPSFTSRELNARTVSNKRREDFIRAVGGDPADLSQPPRNLRRFEVENAIVILVPKTAVDLSSLVKTPKDGERTMPLKHIVWLSKRQSGCTVANGAGRIDYVQNVLCHQETATKKQQLLILKKDNGREPNHPAIKDAHRLIKNMDEILKETSNWMVAVYDLDAIERSENAIQIKLALAANVPAYQAPDSEDEALHLILTNISPLPRKDWVKELENYRSQITSGPKRLAPVIRNQRLILAMLNVQRHARYWEDTMKVTQYYDWRTSISPFIEAFLDRGTFILDYLASNIPVPKDTKVVTIDSIVQSINPICNLFDSSFFSLISKCYVRHLYTHRTSYGIEEQMQEKGSTTYVEAFKLYVEDLAAEIPDWIQSRLSLIREILELEQAQKCLGGLVGRIRFALMSPVFNSSTIGLVLPTSTPLLCRSFLLDMGSYLHGLSSPLMEVFRMVDPMFPGVLLESRSSNPFKDQPSAMLEQLVNDLKPKTETKIIINELLSVIFRHRTLALVKINTLNNANPLKNPPRAELTGRLSSKAPSTVGVFYQQDLSLQSLLKCWRYAAVSGDPDKILLMKLRRSTAPSMEKAALKELDHGDMLLRIVTSTAFRWAACTGSQMGTVAKTVSGYALNTLWFHINHHLRYLKTNEVWEMREQMDGVFDNHLMKWCGFWDEVSNQPEGKMPELSQTKISLPRKLQLQTIGKEMDQKLNDGVSSLVRILRRKEMGGIPAEDENGKITFLIAGNVYDAAETLLKELAIASMCAQSMYTDPSMDRMAIVQSRPRDDMLNALEIPPEFQKAMEEDMREYYESMDVDTINKTDIFAEGSLKMRVKVAAQDSKKLQKKKRRAGGLLSNEFVSARQLLEDENLIPMEDVGKNNSDSGSVHPGSEQGSEEVQTAFLPRRSGRKKPIVLVPDSEEPQADDPIQDDTQADETEETEEIEFESEQEETLVHSSSPKHNSRRSKRKVRTPVSDEERASTKRTKVASTSETTPETHMHNASPPGAPSSRRIGLLAAPTDDDTDLPSTFPNATPQAPPSPLARQSSPLFGGEFTEEEWAAAAAQPDVPVVAPDPQETPLEHNNPLIVKKLNTASGKLMITRAM